MNMTNLFVELVVIGIGAFGWIGLLLLNAWGQQNISATFFSSPITLGIGLSIVYVLGIITDRSADTIFKLLFDTGKKRPGFKDLNNYHQARMTVLCGPGSLVKTIEYGRSRIRICRGWALNSIMILISWNLFIWQQIYFTWMIMCVGSILWLGIGIACMTTWRSLRRDECNRIKAQAHFLRGLENSQQQQKSSNKFHLKSQSAA